jgi:hypothetical protein
MHETKKKKMMKQLLNFGYSPFFCFLFKKKTIENAQKVSTCVMALLACSTAELTF